MKTAIAEQKRAINLELDWSELDSKIDSILREFDIREEESSTPDILRYETDEDLFLAQFRALDSSLDVELN